jgi:SAM-dependent MidA family methyltransferase
MNALEAVIRREIAEKGAMPFARFMELALYHPEHGYYERAATTIGRSGDYFTSVSVGGLFGELLAFRFADWLEEKSEVRSPKSEAGGGGGPGQQIVEAGAHDGRLAADILGWLKANRPGLFAALEYWIVEPSPRRRVWQERTLRAYAGKVRWLTALPTPASRQQAGTRIPESRGVRGVIFGNELLDALPVQRLGWDAVQRRWFEWGVATEGERFVWARIPRADAESLVAAAVLLREPEARELTSELRDVLPDRFTVEVCPAAVEWWSTAAAALKQGKLLTLDYGMTAEELLRPERQEGTLRTYAHHRVTRDALQGPGEQDLTAHVNFSALQAAGEAAGLKTDGFSLQSQFLAAIVERTMKPGSGFGEWTPARTRQLQTLTHPDHLGRAFRVLVQSR